MTASLFRIEAPHLFRAMLGLALLVVAIDQASKFYVFNVLLVDEAEIAVLPFFSLVPRYNTGISFSFLASAHDLMPWVFAGAASGIAIGLGFWLAHSNRLLPALGLGLVIGGAVGNIIDRVRLGAVLDFLLVRWPGQDWPGLNIAFNLADAGISAGVVLLILDGLLPVRKEA